MIARLQTKKLSPIISITMKENRDGDVYAVIDLKSFYASCECAARGLDIFTTPLVVADKSRSANSVVMSVSPILKKKYNIPNVCRIRDLPEVPNLIYATPRMAYYITMSARVVSIFLDYVGEDDLHVYSIDESFLYLTPYLSLYNCSAEEICASIQKKIKDKLGLVATCGLGPNMFLAKVCLDNEAKKKPPYIARWTYEDVQRKLWRINPITKIWGISTGISTRLDRLGIRNMESLAKVDPMVLKREFGVIGEQLHALSNGIDQTDIHETYTPKEHNLSIGQTLMKNYDIKGAKLVLREMCDDLCLRLRLEGKKAGRVAVSMFYGLEIGGGFSKQATLDIATDDNDSLMDAIYHIVDSAASNLPIRGLGISFSKLEPYKAMQWSLFEEPEEAEERRVLNLTIDDIQLTYGRNSVLRATSLLPDSTIKERHGQIGGHKA